MYEFIEIVNPNPRRLQVIVPAGDSERVEATLGTHDKLTMNWIPGTKVCSPMGRAKVVLRDATFSGGDEWLMEAGPEPREIIRPFDDR